MPNVGTCVTGKTITEVYCSCCESMQPYHQEEPHHDALNPYPWYDLVCMTCHFVIATFHIRPLDP